MIAAVTGGCGFIGSALVRALQHSPEFSEIRVLSRTGRSPAGSTPIRGDLLSGAQLLPFLQGADVLFHCAAEMRHEDRMSALNINGTHRLITAAEKGRVARWVQLSSVGVYGAVRIGTVTENSPIDPAGEYERTKALSDALVTEQANRGLFSCSIVRPSIVFGPGMPNRSVAQLGAAVRRGLFFHIGNNAIANYVYVDDVADALLACAAKDSRGVYIVSDDRPMENFIAAIADSVGSKRRPPRIPALLARAAAAVGSCVPGFPLTRSRVDVLTRKVRYSSSRIQSEREYSFRVSIEQGLRRTLAPEYFR